MRAVSEGMTVGAVLRLDVLDALERRILVSYALGLSRVQLITQSEHALTSSEALAIASLFERRLAGEPIAYIVGEREFYGLPLAVTPHVLIPRPETELLVELALDKAPQGSVLDMGTGSGAIAVAIAHARPDLKVSALDSSLPALQIAQQNAERHKAAIRFLHSDWYGALDEEDRFDVIVSNPPYIVAGDAHLSQGDLRFEPADALTDHADGLAALRTIIKGAPQHLKPGGWLMMEHGYDQAEAVRALLSQAGFSDVQSWKDLASIERVSGGRFA